MINAVFENLSYRLRNENNLSDITWSLCQSSKSFKNDFLTFFFPEIDIKEITEFEREKTEGNSRADFYVECKKKIYIIECKIYDGNHHFEQYCEAYDIPSNRLGYIMNYHYTKNGFTTKTWSDLFSYLDDKKDLVELMEQPIYNAYLTYLKNVCSIVKIKDMININGMYNLYCFSETLKALLVRETDNFKIEIYSKEFKDWRIGYNIKVSSDKEELSDIWIWIGAYHDRPKPVVCFEVWNNDGWGKPFFEKIKENKENFESIYSAKPYEESNCYYFETSSNFLYEFEKTEDVNSQKELLKKFIDEVITFYVS